jgi:hypothetical protein
VSDRPTGAIATAEDPEAMAGALETLLEMSPADRRTLGQKGRRDVEETFDMRTLGDRMEHLPSWAIEDRGRAMKFDDRKLKEIEHSDQRRTIVRAHEYRTYATPGATERTARALG